LDEVPERGNGGSIGLLSRIAAGVEDDAVVGEALVL
jgi:hypothetical protein